MFYAALVNIIENSYLFEYLPTNNSFVNFLTIKLERSNINCHVSNSYLMRFFLVIITSINFELSFVEYQHISM